MKQVKLILSSKTDKAERDINEFLKDKDPETTKIRPLLTFNGPSYLVGAMVIYTKGVSDEVSN